MQASQAVLKTFLIRMRYASRVADHTARDTSVEILGAPHEIARVRLGDRVLRLTARPLLITVTSTHPDERMDPGFCGPGEATLLARPLLIAVTSTHPDEWMDLGFCGPGEATLPEPIAGNRICRPSHLRIDPGGITDGSRGSRSAPTVHTPNERVDRGAVADRARNTPH